MWSPYAFKQTLDGRRWGELGDFFKVFQDITFAKAPVSSFIRSLLPLLKIHNRKPCRTVFGGDVFNIQAINKKFILTTALINHFIYIPIYRSALAAEVVWTSTLLNRTFPKLGTHFAHAWYRISCNFVFYHGFVLLDPESEFACHKLELGLCLGAPSILATPFILTNSLCASYEDREISTAFCRSSFGSRGSRSFSAVFSVDNTILYLIMLSGLANSQDRESVRSWVENSSNVWPDVFEWSQNWYPGTALSNLVHIRS